LAYIKRLARVEEISFADESEPVPAKSATAVVSASKIVIPLAELIDLDAEIARQQKKLDKLMGEKNALTGRLSNKKFVENAPKEVIEETQAKVDEISVQQEIIEQLIISLK